jgi:hypothetical protein
MSVAPAIELNAVSKSHRIQDGFARVAGVIRSVIVDPRFGSERAEP